MVLEGFKPNSDLVSGFQGAGIQLWFQAVDFQVYFRYWEKVGNREMYNTRKVTILPNIQ